MDGSRNIQISAYLAISIAVLLAIGETAVNWGDWQWWPYFMVDYIASFILLVGGMWCLRDMQSRQALALLAAGWAFTVCMAWMSFAGNLRIAMSSDELARHDRVGSVYAYLGIVGIGLLLSTVCLLLIVWPEKKQLDQENG